jgi:hypothetical protein
MATAPTHIKGQKIFVTGPYVMSVADSVDGLLYAPDAANPRNLIVATASTPFCGFLDKKAKVGDPVSLVLVGSTPAIASGAIAAYAAVTTDAAGKCKAGTVGTDQIIGFNDGPATTTDGDIFTLTKIS